MELNILTKNIGRFFFAILLQVLVLSNIEFTSLGLTPYAYLLFILLLPFETSGWLVLVFSLVVGLSVDAFSDTGGAHASATVFMGFVRPLVLNIVSPRDGYETGTFPRVYYMGTAWFLRYSLILIFLHHIFYFFIELFTFADFFSTMLRILFTTLFSGAVILLSQFLIFRK